MHRTHRLSRDGAVDADGHILEPSDRRETDLEPRHRERAIPALAGHFGADLEIAG